MTEPTASRMVVALTDIAGFAKACEGRTDAETFAALDEHYRLVADAVGKADGTVVKFMGDSVLISFPEDRAAEAVAALRELASSDGVRFKAHVGSVASGPIGPGESFDVVGNTINELFLMPAAGPELSDALAAVVS